MTVSLLVELPDNLPACHAIIRRQAEVIEELTARIERLNRDLAALKRHLFGSRRERFVAGMGEDPAGEEVVLDGRATQWRWMRAVAGIVLPLVELMRHRTMQSRVQGIDETPCPLICPERGRTRSAYLYAQYGDSAHPYVCFAFASHKNEENVRRIVGSYEGYLQSDAYICYELIAAASGSRIVAVGCWAHARRKFEPLIQAGPHPQATWILGEIQKLYDVEDRAREMTDSQRLALRQAESRPIVTGIRTWLDERDREELPRSPLRAGVNYLRNRWEAFERFLEDGAIPIDNNRTEGMIKGPVMGKKAWLFFGNESAGETAAALYTLTMTCKRHAIDVQAYLVDVFRRI
ncbi:MAG: IS66 family transposase, partial [Planctomycetota bacterium]